MPQILERLVSQLMAKGMGKAQAYAIATSTLQKSGSLKQGSTEMTSKGKHRSELGASGRAKDRAAHAGGHKAGDYVYSKKTNRATLKK